MKVVQTRIRGGFTLVEVMIAVAVVAILAAIAFPSYSEHIRKGKRATAQAALTDLAGKEQNYLLDRRAYTDSLAALQFSLPGEIANDYTISFPATGDCAATAYVPGANPPTFCAQATPSAALLAKGERPLTIDHTGARTPANTPGYWGK